MVKKVLLWINEGDAGVLRTWWQTRDAFFLAGGILILANWPWTIFMIYPVNTVLMKKEPERADAQTSALIVRWGHFHAVRSLLGVAATAIFLGLVQITRAS